MNRIVGEKSMKKKLVNPSFPGLRRQYPKGRQWDHGIGIGVEIAPK
ncbi:MAG: hypothetical protein IIC13_03185 [SAR324 cluster bacterium]|nr:hypothetical protein [SAR324 cluster bacterium]